MSADEIEDQTARLTFVQPKSTTELLLKYQWTLRGAQEEHRIKAGDIDALVVKVDSHDSTDFAAL